MNEEQLYLFDLQGFLVLRNVVPPSTIEACNTVLDRLETIDPEDYPAAVTQSKPRTKSELYISNIVEADPVFHQFIDLPPVIDIISDVSLGLYRLNHTYAIYHWGNGYTPMHMAGTPIHPKASYQCQNGQVFSLLTKAVYPLRHHDPEDGCFAVVPGSHKANFSRPFGDHPDENQALIPVPAQPGDAVVFSESLTHGSLVNTSGRERRTFYFCYSVGYMPDWTKLGLAFSDQLYTEVSDEQRETLRLKII